MDAAMELAEQTSPDVVIANDPDADRCAVAVPGPGGWRMLRGDEVGALLGAHVLSRGAAGGVLPDSPDCVFANSIVSSRLLAAICRAAGVRHEETLTGFKWIGRVPGLRYGYEEALGTASTRSGARQGRGVGRAARRGARGEAPRPGRTLPHPLDDLAPRARPLPDRRVPGAVADLSQIGQTVHRLRSRPPGSARWGGSRVDRGGRPGRRITGRPRRAAPHGRSPAAHLGDGTRVIVRPAAAPSRRSSATWRSSSRWAPVERRLGAGPAGRGERAATRLAGIRTDLEAATPPEPAPARPTSTNRRLVPDRWGTCDQ